MRRVVRSRTYVAQLKTFIQQGTEAFGAAVAARTLARIDHTIEQHLALNPDDVRALGHGAGILALLGRSTESKRYIAKAAALRPDDYGNLGTLACAAMLDDDPDGALDLLERAVGTGRGDREWILADNDLKPLHGHPRFQALIDKLARA